MIGTMVVNAFGPPITPSPLGPSHPCAPIIQMIVISRPTSERIRSRIERVNSHSSAAITTRATTISSSISEPVAAALSSSVMAGDSAAPASGPWLALAMSRIANSASVSISACVSASAVSRSAPALSPAVSAAVAAVSVALARSSSRTVATVTCVPSASLPTSRSSAGFPAVASSICCWETEAKSSVPSAAPSCSAAETIRPDSSGATRESACTSPSVRLIWASPSGVSTGPRKMILTATVSWEPPNSASILSVARATSLSSGRNTVLSACSANRVNPAPSPTVSARSTRIVTSGLAVTIRLKKSATRDISDPPRLPSSTSCVTVAEHLTPQDAGVSRSPALSRVSN